MKKMIIKILTRLILLLILIYLLMYESNADISYLYANF